MVGHWRGSIDDLAKVNQAVVRNAPELAAMGECVGCIAISVRD